MPNSGGQLSVEGARAALIKFVETTDDVLLKFTLDDLRNAEPLHDGKFAYLGSWRCDLQSQQFGAIFDSEPIYAEFFGHFQQNEKREWSAVLDGWVRS